MSLNLIPVMISGVGYCVPETVITNNDLTKLVETSDEWITTRSGIRERRVVSGALRRNCDQYDDFSRKLLQTGRSSFRSDRYFKLVCAGQFQRE